MKRRGFVYRELGSPLVRGYYWKRKTNRQYVFLDPTTFESMSLEEGEAEIKKQFK